ncbi:MAG: ribonuclease E/G [Acetobacter lovaniensis]|nr:ribonuclease E/G [Acetobacter lovaniensis]MCI1795999.1 ribonuclease E/G [Acetobacter lovaniensis]
MSLFLRIATFPGEMRIAVTRNDTLLDFALWRPAAPDMVGSVYHARIEALTPAMGGAFVALGGNQSGFLPLQNNAPKLTEGQAVTVEVSRAAQGGKGLRLRLLAADVASEQKGLVTPGPTPLARLAALWPTAAVVVDSPAAAALIPPALRDRREPGFAPYPDSIAAACDALEEPLVALPGGMEATITPTPALIAIDMDAPPAQTDHTKQTAQFAANRDALPALMRQIRLRNLSGAILIDPAGLATRKRHALLEPVNAALKPDPLNPRCLGITALGLIEIVRARIYPSLPELLNSPHGRALRVLRHILVHAPQTTQITGGAGIIRALEQDPEAVADCARQLGHKLSLHTNHALPDLTWTVQES